MKIVLIVAHPDDETLWFFQSIQHLKIYNEITVFCLTHAAISKRGKELTKIADELGFKVVFGHCEDTGINRLLNKGELSQAYIKIFSKYKFDIAITHPPHGGEKPHPHHIQLFIKTKEFCEFYSMRFGFFSERQLLHLAKNSNTYSFNLSTLRYIIGRLILAYGTTKENEERNTFFLKAISSILFKRKNFIAFQTAVNLPEKQAVLANFESQEEVLRSYNTFFNASEFLFLVE